MSICFKLCMLLIYSMILYIYFSMLLTFNWIIIENTILLKLCYILLLIPLYKALNNSMNFIISISSFLIANIVIAINYISLNGLQYNYNDISFHILILVILFYVCMYILVLNFSDKERSI